MAKPRLPTPQEILSLPRWAQVAFAARCARRVQPLLTELLSESITAGEREQVDRAIRLSEEVAAEAPGYATDAVVIRLHSAFKATSKLAAKADKKSERASAAIQAASQAALCAEYVNAPTRTENAKAAAFAAETAGIADPECPKAIRQDFQKLLKAAKKEEWTGDTPVPPGFFIE